MNFSASQKRCSNEVMSWFVAFFKLKMAPARFILVRFFDRLSKSLLWSLLGRRFLSFPHPLHPQCRCPPQSATSNTLSKYRRMGSNQREARICVFQSASALPPSPLLMALMYGKVQKGGKDLLQTPDLKPNLCVFLGVLGVCDDVYGVLAIQIALIFP